MANDINEWVLPTYRLWRGALLRFVNIRDAEAKIAEAFAALTALGCDVELSETYALARVSHLREKAFAAEQEAFDRHVEGFLTAPVEGGEGSCHGVPTSEK